MPLELLAVGLASSGVGCLAVAVRYARLHFSPAGEIRALRQESIRTRSGARRALERSGTSARDVVSDFRRAAERSTAQLASSSSNPERVLIALQREQEKALYNLDEIARRAGVGMSVSPPRPGRAGATSRQDAARASQEILAYAGDQLVAAVRENATLLREIALIEREWVSGDPLPATPEELLAGVATRALQTVVAVGATVASWET